MTISVTFYFEPKRKMEGQVKVLLEAERAAQEIIQKAREQRDIIMRQADESAKAEIEKYRFESDGKLNKLQNEIDQEIEQVSQKLEEETLKDLSAFQSNLDEKLSKVSKLLIDASICIKIE